MAFEIVLSLYAREDIDETVSWYESQQKGLGLKFLQYLRVKLQKISANPKAYPDSKFKLRKAVLTKFPFVVYYRLLEKDQKIIIFAVWHSKRNPKFLKQRRQS